MSHPLTPPPLRAEPFTEDSQDGERVTYSDELWNSQDAPLAARDRQIEENVRMLAGQQWIIWSERVRRFIDIKELLEDDERRYKQRPVLNKESQWFILNHARMTENPPVIAFQPSTADAVDSDLASVMDVVSKSLWHDLNMEIVRSDLAAWMLVGGVGYLYTQIDPSKGDPIEFHGPATVRMLNPVTGLEEDFLVAGDDGQPAQVPYAPNSETGEFEPQIEVDPETGDVVATGDAWKEHEGGIRVQVLGPLEVRGEWGANIPWHEKSWHQRTLYLTPEQVKQTWGVEVEADPSLDLAGVGQLERLLRGTGYFGAARENVLEMSDSSAQGDPVGLVRIRETWVAPGTHGTPMQTDDDPGGRLLVVAGGQDSGNGMVIRDGTRPAAYRYTSPMRQFDMVRIPGSPHGRSPLEWLNPIQRLINRTWGQILEHTNLVAHPIMVKDSMANIPKITNRPGQSLNVTRRPGVPAIEFVAPPRLNEDVFRQLALLSQEFEDAGNMIGAGGRAPQPDDNSGALIRELRFNSDRFMGAPLRRSAEEFGRFWEDVMETVKVTWSEEKVISWAGDDDVLRTVTVTPEMWKGRVNVKPDLESMLPESRRERQERAQMLYEMGSFGDPLSPEARMRFFQMARFPHLGRAFKPGGVHWETARYVMGLIAQGKPGHSCPIYSWYDLDIWMAAIDEYMAAPTFLRLDPKVQEQLVLFRQKVLFARQAKVFDDTMRDVNLQAQLQAAGMQAQLAAGGPQLEAATSQALAPPPEDGGSGSPQATPPQAGMDVIDAESRALPEFTEA